MGRTDLDNYEYDSYLASKKGSREARQTLEQRHAQRKNSGFTGWHWGLGDKPVKCNDKEDFKRELDKRGLMMRDDVKRTLK